MEQTNGIAAINSTRPPAPVLITAALPYGNGPLHVGHAYEHCSLELRHRARLLLGGDSLRSCCTDAHGAPVALSALHAGREPLDWALENAETHGRTLRDLGLWSGPWGSTHSERNRDLTLECYFKARSLGLLVDTESERPFCPLTGAAQPDRFIEGSCPSCGEGAKGGEDCPACQTSCSPESLVDSHCSGSGLRPEWRRAKSVALDVARAFRALGISTAELLALAGPRLASKASEWLDDPLPIDICRPRPYFGWNNPDNEDLSFQVWWDAHLGYLSSVEPAVIEELRSGTRTLICGIGKDIARFHLTIFPIQLRLLGLPLPSELSVHGFIVAPDGRKLSKSAGNAPELSDLAKHGASPLRLALGLACKPGVADTRFEPGSPRLTWNSRVVSGCANLAARSLALLTQRPDFSKEEIQSEEARRAVSLQADGSVSEGLELAFSIADRAQRSFTEKAPWKLSGAERESSCIEALLAAYSCAWALTPAAPEIFEAVFRAQPKEIVIPRLP